MPKTKQKSVRISSARSEDQPATRKMLSLVRDELSHKMESGFNDLKSEIHSLKSEINGIESEIHGIKSEMHGIKSEMHSIKSETHGIKSDVLRIEAGNSRMQLLLEEQNANNRIVLEGLQALWQRQDRIEERQGL